MKSCEKCTKKCIAPSDSHTRCLKCLGATHEMSTCADCLNLPVKTRYLRHKQQEMFIFTGNWVGKDAMPQQTSKMISEGMLPPTFDKRKMTLKKTQPAESPAAHSGHATQGASRSSPGASGQKGDVSTSLAGLGTPGRAQSERSRISAPGVVEYMRLHPPVLTQAVGAAAQVGAAPVQTLWWDP